MPSSRLHPKEQRWTSPLTIAVVSLLVFETVSGLAIWGLPFSVTAQMTVLVHTVGGLALLGPYLVYQVRHWNVYFADRPLDYLKLTGYLSLAATVGALVSGVVLTWQALFGRAIGPIWSDVHLLATFALVGAMLIHLVAPVLRGWNVRAGVMQAIRRAQGLFGWNVLFHVGAGVALVTLFVYALSPATLYREVPATYERPYGLDSLFAPSLAKTDSNRLLTAEALGGSEGCGAAGCHKQIYEEWAPSAHRYSAMDPAFRAIQKRMAERKGPTSTRYCGGCHDPISLVSGSKSMLRDDMSNDIGYHEGTSCMTCHSVKEVDVKGNADYVIDPPKRYVGELGEGGLSEEVSQFLIRAYPDYHRESLSRELYKTPEYCGACHKQFIDETVNDVGWMQLQNQYDNWRKSRWHRPEVPTETIQCRECHMPLTDSFDPSSGDDQDYNRSPDDGKHRSHRFQAANQFIPRALGLPEADEHIDATEAWLKGEYPIPEIEEKWTDGPVIPLEILAPDSVRAGQRFDVQVRLTNNKAGHNAPTGPLDLIQAWVRVSAVTPVGDTLFSSGMLTDRHYLEPGSFVFKAELVDQDGNLVDFHNLWEMVGVNFSRTLFPGFSDRAEYQVEVPPEAGEGAYPLRIQAELDYRKFNQSFYNEILQDSLAADTAPITTLSSAVDTVGVVRAEAIE